MLILADNPAYFYRYDVCSEDRINSKLLLKLNCAEFRLCKGIPKEALESSAAKFSELYVEQFNDGVSVRSRECELAMAAGVETCPACVRLAEKLCPEGKRNSPSSAVLIKIKPDLPDCGAESDEVFQILNARHEGVSSLLRQISIRYCC